MPAPSILTAQPLHHPWPRILAFHGEKDRTVPAYMGRRTLQQVFGEPALLPPRGIWHEFSDEDHTLKRDESFAVVYATILHELGVSKCR